MNSAVNLFPIIIFIGLTSLFLIWRYGWITYFIDEYRFRLFRLRDSLFQILHSHDDLPVTSDLYRELRRRINIMINTADKFTFFEVLRLGILYKSFNEIQTTLETTPFSISDYISLADEFEEELSKELKDQLREIETLFYYETAIHLIKRTIILWVPFAILMVIGLLSKQNSSKRNEIKKSKKLINTKNISIGHKLFDTFDNFKKDNSTNLAHA